MVSQLCFFVSGVLNEVKRGQQKLLVTVISRGSSVAAPLIGIHGCKPMRCSPRVVRVRDHLRATLRPSCGLRQSLILSVKPVHQPRASLRRQHSSGRRWHANAKNWLRNVLQNVRAWRAAHRVDDRISAPGREAHRHGPNVCMLRCRQTSQFAPSTI